MARRFKEMFIMIFETLLTHPLFQRILNSIIDGQNNTYHSCQEGNILKHPQGSRTWFSSTRILGFLSKVWTHVHVCMLGHFSRVWLFASLWTISHQAPLSTGFSRKEYWSGLPCPPPRNLPNPGIEPTSPALQVDSSLLTHEGSPVKTYPATGHFILKNASPYKGKAAVSYCPLCQSSQSQVLDLLKKMIHLSLQRMPTPHVQKISFFTSIPEDVIITSCNVSNYDLPGLVDLEVW